MMLDDEQPHRQSAVDRWFLPPSASWLRFGIWLSASVATLLFIFLNLFTVSDGWVLWLLFAWSVIGVLLLQRVRAQSRRRPPYCIHCGYSLTGLADKHRCPECGEPFSIEECHEYHKDPLAYIELDRRRRWEAHNRIEQEIEERSA